MNQSPEQEGRSRALRSLLSSDGWQILEKAAEDKLKDSLRRFDDMPIETIGIGVTAYEKGFRKGVRWLMDEARTVAEIG